MKVINTYIVEYRTAVEPAVLYECENGNYCISFHDGGDQWTAYIGKDDALKLINI